MYVTEVEMLLMIHPVEYIPDKAEMYTEMFLI